MELLGKYKNIIKKLNSIHELSQLNDIQEVDTHKLLLDKSAERVIEEATKLRTKDIC